MKRLLTISFTGGMLAVSALAQTGWTEEYFRAKYGRSSPTEEARLKAEQATTAFREETTDAVAPAVPNWIEQYFRAKYGRSSPTEEARLKAEQASTAFREEPTRDVAPPVPNWIEQHLRVKLGRAGDVIDR
jgi:hypothetical protein